MRYLTVVGIAAAMLGGSAFATEAATADKSLYLRSGPGAGFGVVGTAPTGAQLKVRGCSGGWCAVSYHGRSGYARESHLADRRKVSRVETKHVHRVAHVREPRVYFYGPSYYPNRPLGYYDPRGWKTRYTRPSRSRLAKY